MRIAIFGVGAVGGYFGAKLAQSNHDVFFIARGKHLAAIREHGLRVSSDAGDFVAYPTLATEFAADIGVVDVVVLATKAWQVEAAAQSMQPLIGAETIVVPLLNGVEAPLKLIDHLEAASVLGGFCRVLSRVESAGQIVQGGTLPFVSFGEMAVGAPSERVLALRDIFESVGVAVKTPDNIQAAMWQKLLFIASFGGVGAVTRMSAGVLRQMQGTRTLLEDAMREVKQVAMARGVIMVDDAVAIGMSQIDALPYDATASMQRDIMSGYPSELDAQNGAVVRLGRVVNVSAPTHQFIYRALLPSEHDARGLLPERE